MKTPRRLATLPIAAGILVLATGLSIAFPWSIDMFRGEAVQPLAMQPRNVPPGILPAHGGMPMMSRDEASRRLTNPLTPSSENLHKGGELFETHCMPCHGADAKGYGPVKHLLRVPPANLTAGQPVQRTDGYLFATIRDGSFVMPSYGDAMSVDERWAVVLYLRRLQGRLAGAVK